MVFMDNKPNGLEHGKDYVSVVSADNYGNGVEAAHVMAKAIGEQGDIGVIFHDADFFVTKQRTDAFEKKQSKRIIRTSRSWSAAVLQDRTTARKLLPLC